MKNIKFKEQFNAIPYLIEHADMRAKFSRFVNIKHFRGPAYMNEQGYYSTDTSSPLFAYFGSETIECELGMDFEENEEGETFD